MGSVVASVFGAGAEATVESDLLPGVARDLSPVTWRSQYISPIPSPTNHSPRLLRLVEEHEARNGIHYDDIRDL